MSYCKTFTGPIAIRITVLRDASVKTVIAKQKNKEEKSLIVIVGIYGMSQHFFFLLPGHIEMFLPGWDWIFQAALKH